MIKLPQTDNNVCISFSGGLDSTVLVALLCKTYGPERVKAISFDFGQRHSVELSMASLTAEKLGFEHKILKLDYLSDISKSSCSLIDGSEIRPKTAEENAGNPQVDTYVPFRNLQFAAITAAFAETHDADYIFQALNQVDMYGYWDTTEQFRDSVNSVLSLNRQNKIQFLAPFIELYKEDELKLAIELSSYFGFDLLENTWSCYNGSGDIECGKCNTCAEKLLGYIRAGFENEYIMNKFDVSAEEITALK